MRLMRVNMPRHCFYIKFLIKVPWRP
ncbi:hypothetical protein Golax_003028, partial [Gossypium laxum]|nr:hypothetical protein [Gossypium laxum]